MCGSSHGFNKIEPIQQVPRSGAAIRELLESKNCGERRSADRIGGRAAGNGGSFVGRDEYCTARPLPPLAAAALRSAEPCWLLPPQSAEVMFITSGCRLEGGSVNSHLFHPPAGRHSPVAIGPLYRRTRYKRSRHRLCQLSLRRAPLQARRHPLLGLEEPCPSSCPPRCRSSCRGWRWGSVDCGTASRHRARRLNVASPHATTRDAEPIARAALTGVHRQPGRQAAGGHRELQSAEDQRQGGGAPPRTRPAPPQGPG